IRVTTLAPGFTLTATVMRENPGHVETARDRAIQSRSLRRDEHPQDLLGALVFLASPESDFVPGRTLAVDGGNLHTCHSGLQGEIVSLYTDSQVWVSLYC